jgi:hypothetical protein
MINKAIKAIHRLRILFLIIIAAGFLYTAGLNPVDVSVFLGAKLGRAVGMSTSVPENPFNKLTKELREKEEKLDTREAGIKEREEAIAEETISRQQNLIMVMAIGLVVLFLLVVLNYYLDFRRRQRNREKTNR